MKSRIGQSATLTQRWSLVTKGIQCVRCQSNSSMLATSLVPRGGHLAKILRDSIKATGPIPLSRYMQFCLSHPIEGYYSKGDVFGRKGDFITSPEISQVFGELVAVWLLTRYIAAGSPKRVRVIELGPGRGTLMDDFLRTLSRFPGILDAIKTVHLVENSEKMRALQDEKLARYRQDGVELEWTDKLDEMLPSEDYTMLVAHEFFDAMPINLFERTQEGWREVSVDLDPSYDPSLPTHSTPSGLRLAISRTPSTLSSTLPTTSPRFTKLPVGTRIEVAQESWKVMRKVGEILGSEGGAGAGLVVDYGGDRVFGSSFRAFRNHKIVDIFERPGSADLTANVDFGYLREAVSGLGAYLILVTCLHLLTSSATPLGPVPQSQFLTSLGLQPRLDKLLASASTPERRDDIQKGAKRLIDPLGMGAQYQVMGIVSTTEEEIYPFPSSSTALSPEQEKPA